MKKENRTFHITWVFFLPFFIGAIACISIVSIVSFSSIDSISNFYLDKLNKQEINFVKKNIHEGQDKIARYLNLIKKDFDFVNAFYFSSEEMITLKKPLTDILTTYKRELDLNLAITLDIKGNVLYSDVANPKSYADFMLDYKSNNQNIDFLQIGNTPYLAGSTTISLFDKSAGYLIVGFEFGQKYLNKLKKLTQMEYLIVGKDKEIIFSTISDKPLLNEIEKNILKAERNQCIKITNNYLLSPVSITNGNHDTLIDFYLVSDLSYLDRFKNNLLKSILLIFLLIFVFVSSVYFYFSNKLSQKINSLFVKIKTYQEEITRQKKNSAIAKTTQMLAHDVRTPFSQLKAILDLFKYTRNIDEINKFANEAIPKVKKSLLAVDGMINDIMEIGRTNEPQKEPNSLITLIEISLKDIFQLYHTANITFTYNFNHTKMLHIEKLKIQRVLSNIIENAVQAMKCNGELYFESKEIIKSKNRQMEIVVGNNGSKISEKDLKDLFEAFFTKHKSNGTGLGLAIAKQVVNTHGGGIWCESPGEKYSVEFHFTLPMIDLEDDHLNIALPKYSNEISRILEDQLGFEHKIAGTSLINDKRVSDFERFIISAYNARHKPFTVALVDDESIYRDAFKRLIDDSTEIGEAIVINLFADSSDILRNSKYQMYDYIICDIDMGMNALNGYELTALFRNKGFKGKICIHSNRSLPEDYKKAIAIGADTFFPKPMSRAHLLKMISDTAHGMNC